MKKLIFRRLFYLICIMIVFYSFNYLCLQSKFNNKITKNEILIEEPKVKVSEYTCKNKWV